MATLIRVVVARGEGNLREAVSCLYASMAGAHSGIDDWIAAGWRLLRYEAHGVVIWEEQNDGK